MRTVALLVAHAHVQRPFHGTAQSVADAVRLFVIFGGLVFIPLVGRYGLLLRKERPAGWFGRLWLVVALACFSISAVFTEWGRLGDVVTWRLPFNAGGVVAGLVAMWLLVRFNRR